MKKTYLHFLLLLLAPFLFLVGCQDDELVDDTPDIVLSTSQQTLNDLDLDKSTGPNVRGWATAPAGLKRVSVVVEKASGDEELLNETSFTEENSEKNGTAYNFNVYPVYTPDFTAIRITVVDQQDRSAEEILTVKAKGGETGPALSLPSGPLDANIRPSVNIRPIIEGSASTHWGLKSLSIFELRNGQETEVEKITDFGEDDTRYVIVYDPAYDPDLTAVKIVAVDNRDNRTEHTIETRVIDASPAPTVVFGQENIEADLTADPQETPEVSGTVESEYEGLAEVRFYLVYGGEDIEIEEEAVVFEEGDEEDRLLEFGFTPEYRLGVSGIKVVATDDNGQVTTETLAVNVIAEDPDLESHANVTVNAQANRNDDGVETAFSVNGQTYTLAEGLDPAVSENIDFITADSGGDNGLDLFSPSHDSWLPGNYFKKEVSGDMTWPVLNETRMVHLQDKGEEFFNNATSIEIRRLSVGEDYKTRIEFGPDENGNHLTNQVILFENSRGQKGLLLFKESDNAAGKSDVFTFDIKVINE